jgi:hypothetical protein
MGDDGRVTGRRRVVVSRGLGLMIVGLAGALVAWEGMDRANQDLGVPAAVAALVGLFVSVYSVFTTESDVSPGRRVRQVAKASHRARVTQADGSQYAKGEGAAVRGSIRSISARRHLKTPRLIRSARTSR